MNAAARISAVTSQNVMCFMSLSFSDAVSRAAGSGDEGCVGNRPDARGSAAVEDAEAVVPLDPRAVDRSGLQLAEVAHVHAAVLQPLDCAVAEREHVDAGAGGGGVRGGA